MNKYSKKSDSMRHIKILSLKMINIIIINITVCLGDVTLTKLNLPDRNEIEIPMFFFHWTLLRNICSYWEQNCNILPMFVSS